MDLAVRPSLVAARPFLLLWRLHHLVITQLLRIDYSVQNLEQKTPCPKIDRFFQNRLTFFRSIFRFILYWMKRLKGSPLIKVSKRPASSDNDESIDNNGKRTKVE